MKRIGIISMWLLLCITTTLWGTERPGFKNGNLRAYRVSADSTITDKLKIGTAYSLPIADGAAGQVPKTDGTGDVTWQDEAGGGGGGFPYDTLAYDYFIGWYNYADEPSTYIKLAGGNADSTGGDTLAWCIDQKKASGGRILILSGDTLWFYKGSAHDSLPTSGGIDKTVEICGLGKRASVIGMHSNTNVAFNFTTDRHAGKGAGAFLVFRDLALTSGLNATSNGHKKISVWVGQTKIENCLLRRSTIGPTMGTMITGGDSVMIFRNCEFDLFSLGAYSESGAGKHRVVLQNCEGTLGGISFYRGFMHVIGCDLWATSAWSVSQNPWFYFMGGTFVINTDGVDCNFYIQGTRVRAGPSYAGTVSGWHMLSGINSYGICWTGTLHITGGFYQSAAKAVLMTGNNCAILGAFFTNNTAGVDGASTTGNVLVGNAFYNNTTDIAGDWATDSINIVW